MVKNEGGDVQDVTGLDNQAPAGPDSTGSHQGTVLGKGELLSRAVEVGDTGDDQSPLHKQITSVIDLAKTSPSQEISILSRKSGEYHIFGGNERLSGQGEWSHNRTFITGALSDIKISGNVHFKQSSRKPRPINYQKCTVFTPTGLFHMRWKML